MIPHSPTVQNCALSSWKSEFPFSLQPYWTWNVYDYHPNRYTLELLRIADQYQVKRFFAESFKSEVRHKPSPALKTLIKSFSDENVVEFWQLAETHGEANLREEALQFMIQKASVISKKTSLNCFQGCQGMP